MSIQGHALPLKKKSDIYSQNVTYVFFFLQNDMKVFENSVKLLKSEYVPGDEVHVFKADIKTNFMYKSKINSRDNSNSECIKLLQCKRKQTAEAEAREFLDICGEQ